MRKIVLTLIICITAMIPTSCYDSNEVDDLLHIVTIGIDRGVSDKWRLTVQFPTLKGDSSGGGTTGGVGGGNKPTDYLSITVDAPSFFTGINMINSALSRRLNFMHGEHMVVSEDIAKSGLLGEFFAPIMRSRQIRRSMHLLVTKGSAQDFAKANTPAIGTTLSKNIEIIMKEADSTGFYPHITLEDFYDGMKSTYLQSIVTLAAVSKKESFKQDGEKWGNKYKAEGNYYAGELPLSVPNRPQFFGAAVFDGDKMVGELTGEETRLVQMVKGKFKSGYFTMQDPKEPSLAVPLEVFQVKKPKITVNFDRVKPIVHCKLELEGTLLSIQSRINYERPELMPLLERAFEEQIKDGLDKLIGKAKDLKTDLFGFGEHAARHFLTIQEWEEYNWNKQFQNAEITADVKFTVRRTGSQLKSSPIINTEGKE